jgi:aspartyl/asparaginyl-tRNA synthetase
MYETFDYHKVVDKMRRYFKDAKNFIEVPTQSRLSILAACEDPNTIAQFNFDGVEYPLPQTGQMWLEHELLKNPSAEGFFCISTSYRNEPNPIDGRHQKIFPMFEFETKGSMQDMLVLESELLEFLGFEKHGIHCTYDALCERYSTEILEAEHEELMNEQIGNKIFLKEFPRRTHPFWNMKENTTKGVFNKVDVILHGQETIGSAERSCDKEEMRYNFLNQTDGAYANLLFSKFTKERVMKELDEFLEHDFFPRYGGGIGMTRMLRAMQLEGIIGKEND